MIAIKEQVTEKVPGETSLFVSSPYNPAVVAILKQFSGSNYDQSSKVWEVPIIYLSALIDSLVWYDSIEIDLLPAEEVEVVESPTLHSYKIAPLDHQVEGIRYGLTHTNWLLLDAPGLGKTAILIHIAEELKLRNELTHCLVICGINNLKENWVKEIHKHSNLSCRILGQRMTRTGRKVIGTIKDRVAQLKAPIEEDVIITNIETLRSKDIVKAILKGPNKFELIVVDEVHACRTSSSQQGAGLLKLNKAKYKIGATGTLIVNSPLDAYVPLKWIGAERSTLTNFKYFYCTFTGALNNILSGFKNIEFLKDMISKYSLRRTKDLLNLPPKMVVDEYVELNDDQAVFYENVKQGIREQVDKVELNASNILALSTRLRQATACPAILTTENISSAKIDRACDIADQVIENGDKVVIFSTYKETVQILAKNLTQYNCAICTGDVPDDVVSREVDRFQEDPNCKCFIGTWQKCGTGITLTAASYMIFMDTPWTDAVFKQAQDRIYRIGTTKNVIIFNIIAADTIDERVKEIVDSKEAISDYIVDDQLSPAALTILSKYIENL